MAPTTPGMIRPGLKNSTTIPSPPKENRRKETLGSARKNRNFSMKLMFISRRTSPPVSRFRNSCAVPVSEAISTVRPSILRSRSSTFRATKSTTLSSTAWVASYAMALRTVSSSASEFRLRRAAMVRIKAAVSSTILLFSVSGMSSPPDPTGAAAPMLGCRGHHGEIACGGDESARRGGLGTLGGTRKPPWVLRRSGELPRSSGWS